MNANYSHQHLEKPLQRHLIVVNYSYDNDCVSASALIERFSQLTCWVDEYVKSGVRVTVFQRYAHDTTFSKAGVNYIFLRDLLPGKFGHLFIALRFNRKIYRFAKSLKYQTVSIFIHSFLNAMSILHIARLLGNSLPIFIQHHAERIRSTVHREILKKACANIAGGFFSTLAHAQPWLEHKILTSSCVYALMECTSTLQPMDKLSAKASLGYEGLLLLWTGNLNNNKDPLTVLRGVQSFLQTYRANLLMIFRERELVTAVKALIKELGIEHRVSILGYVEHQEMAVYFSAADIFVQGSYREGSGISVLEAMCCGALPVVTDIPSFQAITDDSEFLWKAGDANSLKQSLEKVAAMKNIQAEQTRCIEFYNDNWSAAALISKSLNLLFPESRLCRNN